MFDARSLLDELFGLLSREPNIANWTEDALAQNPPRLIRLRRLVAMFRAFELPWDVSRFLDGKFVDVEHPAHAALIAQADRELGGHDDYWVRRDQLPRFFTRLLEYRRTIDRALRFNSGVLEASGFYAFAVDRIEHVNTQVRASIATIDDLLAALIAPDARKFSQDQLVAQFGFPDDDLWEIDAEWA